ncbi:MAG: hypothetical protein J6M53_06360 [Bacteroidaceae bacterium]|nr:hypothetical protein [Bacteroidaceae bacterium]
MKHYISPAARVINMLPISPLFENTVGHGGGGTTDKWTRRGEADIEQDSPFRFDWE